MFLPSPTRLLSRSTVIFGCSVRVSRGVYHRQKRTKSSVAQRARPTRESTATHCREPPLYDTTPLMQRSAYIARLPINASTTKCCRIQKRNTRAVQPEPDVQATIVVQESTRDDTRLDWTVRGTARGHLTRIHRANQRHGIPSEGRRTSTDWPFSEEFLDEQQICTPGYRV